MQMSARWLRWRMVVRLCGFACVLGMYVFPGVAGAASGASQIGLTETTNGIGGSDAGKLGSTQFVAVDNDSSSLFSGDVYVYDNNNERIDRFSASGEFQLAWGWGVANGADELQTCTTVCQRGEEFYGTGSLKSIKGIAIDNESLSASAGDVYAADGPLFRVEKFGPSGEFLSMFGGDVNETTGGNVCTEEEIKILHVKCKPGSQGSADGQFNLGFYTNGSNIAVGPAGRVYVGDTGRVQVFEPSGVWRETISLSGLSSTGEVTALAVDSSGDVFVNYGPTYSGSQGAAEGGAAGVREFEPGGAEKSIQFDAGSTTVASVAVDGSGDVFVGDSEGSYDGFHILKFLPSGKEVDDFGSNTVRDGEVTWSDGHKVLRDKYAGTPDFNGMAFSEASGSASLFVTEALSIIKENNGEINLDVASVWVLPEPPPGPLVEGESAVPAPRAGITFDGMVDPEGNETSYRFEYVTEADFKASGYADASSTSTAKLAAGFASSAVSAQVSSLSPSTVYHYRLVVSNGEGTATGQDGTVETYPPSLIEAEYVTDVASSSATLYAAVNPLGASTEYRFEYGTSTAYGQFVSGSAGGGSSSLTLSVHLQNLEAGTTYHYRVLTSNEIGSVQGADHTFTTQSASGREFVLPDDRAWELVSPPDKNGALIEETSKVQAASDGSGIAYQVNEPIGENISGRITTAEILSSRGPDGWRSRDISQRVALPSEGEGKRAGEEGYESFFLFSPDLSSVAFEPSWFTPLADGVTERTLYTRNDASETYTPLVSAANVPEGTSIDGRTEANAGNEQLVFEAATPDLSHIVFKSGLAVTPGATPTPTRNFGEGNLYEWSAGRLQLIGQGGVGAGQGLTEVGMTAHAISSDGRWVVFRQGENPKATGLKIHYWVWDAVEERAVPFGGVDPNFQTMSSDGSKVLFLETEGPGSAEEGELYVFDPATGKQVDLTADHLDGEHSAGVQNTVTASEDGSYVYFVAKGVLAAGGQSGADNLYMLHEEAGVWNTTYITTLSSDDETDWHVGEGFVNLSNISSHASPDGRYFAFMSDKSLTGYDNLDAASGQPDEEVYLYDAGSNHLVCASCNPTGARPVGVFDTYSTARPLLIDQERSWTKIAGLNNNHWVAGMLPAAWEKTFGWETHNAATYQTRALSDSGRLFFDSTDALVSQDINGTADVYEYETGGVGDCAGASSTFSERADGCVSLISSGKAPSESAFFDASETGDDVFFVTAAKLVPEDYDNSYDVYDAHVCSSAAPCHTAPVSPPACTSGDSCKAAPSPQPEIFGAAPSATFSGIGNVIEEPTKSVVKHKSAKKTKKKTKRPDRRARKRKGKKASRTSVDSASRKGGRR